MANSWKITICNNELPKSIATLLRFTKKKNVFTDNVSLRYLETQPRASAKQLQWHDTLALMNIKLIHKNGKDNVVPNALNHKEEYQREMPWESNQAF